MNVTCPSCGALNEIEALGREVVCASCFHTWTASTADVAGGEPLVAFDLGLDDDGGGDDDAASFADVFGDDGTGEEVFVLGGDDLEILDDEGDEATRALDAMADDDEEEFEVSFGETDEVTGDLADRPLPFAMGGADASDTHDDAHRAAQAAQAPPPARAAAPPPRAPVAPAAPPPAARAPGPATYADDDEDDDEGPATGESPAAYLFTRRRKRRPLSKADMDVIGTYQRRSNDMAHAEDVVWTPDAQGKPRRQPPVDRGPATSQGENPFDQTEVVKGAASGSTQAWNMAPPSSRPATRGGDKTAGFDDPFGAADGGTGDTMAFGTDTASMHADDPFADLGGGAALGDDPFGGDPFGAGGGGDLFGAGPKTGGPRTGGPRTGGPRTGGDPFGTAAFTSGGNTVDGLQELDFSALGDDAPDFGPITTGTRPAAPQQEPTSFFVDPSGTSGKGKAAPAAGDDALFELDVPGGSGAGPQGAPPGGAGPKAAAKKRGRAQRGKRAAGRGGGSGAKVALLGLLVVAGVGVGLGQTDLGYFGINALLGESPATRPEASPMQPVPPPTAGPAPANPMTSDAPQDYTARIAELQGKLNAAPDDARVREELVRTLMRLQERYPEVYKAQPGHAELLKKLLTPAQLSSDKRLLITKLLAEGKIEDANKALDEYVTEMTNNPDDLYLMARVARSQGNTDKAVGYYLSAIEKDATFEPALFDLGEIYLERQEIGEAKKHFAALLADNPKHSGAKLAMAQVALYEKAYDQARTLADEALAVAKDTRNPNEQFRAFWLQAMLAEAQGNAEEKQHALERALEIRPADEETALALAELLNKQGKHQEALIRLKACQTAGCGSAAFFRSLVEAYRLSGQDEDAEAQLTEALRKHPQDTGLQMLQADREETEEHFKTAKAIYANIIEADPSYIEAYLALSRLQLREGRQSDAIETLRSGVDHADDRLPLLEKLAEVQMKVGATLKAKETMGEILQIDPNNTDIKLRFAELLRELGFHEEAVRYYSDLNVAGALNGELTLDFAEELFHIRRYEEATKHVAGVLSTDPLNLRANVLRGAILSAKGEHDAADEALRKALKVNSESGEAYYWLGENELAKGNAKLAIENLSKAADLMNTDLRIRYALGKALMDVGGVDNRRLALAQFSFIIDDYEKYSTGTVVKGRVNPEVYLQRGRLYFDNGQFKEALTDFKAAMLLDPVRQDLIIEFAKTLQTMGKRTEAETYLKEVITRDPRNPAAHFHLGVIELKAGRRNEAEDHFKMAIASGGADFPVAHRYLGFIYKEKGLTALSCSAFREYLRLAPKTAYDREEVARIVSRLCR